jgi:hypothetical protein
MMRMHALAMIRKNLDHLALVDAAVAAAFYHHFQFGFQRHQCCGCAARPQSGGHWHFETAAPEWRSLHHVAGGHFYATGEALSTAAETI